ncbi:hypothetical protein P691DRAFT_778859 [Macrolepiota fuliginosa MF-IS2]|uniref:Nephrocystin 3-like N-terminal domain-containing protein n=1 Tax=Macrolepiota fuliginosa MF-IS2 TaxID=1400762 RepID=A0A9P5X056_9AGAR|nr:hypothetical protein P691DRAFT_779760 [Macrolepiota fuliginosa MF-IS2]KAF9443478.1 hypothetical protein P691DRAFT_778859 [Macrolepiota fuliginosa MF-IS2]
MTESHTFQNAHNFIINRAQFTDHLQPEKRGLKILLKASLPAAAYDSSEHPRNCHPGTRIQYIDQIVMWGMDGPNSGHRIFWLKGPAGVGKSAIAQSCAEEFAAQNKLTAAFFFSRPNQREDPQRLFTSISYQWASKRKSYAEILKSTIHDDPTIVNKELRHQFHHLFVSPLQILTAKGEDISERVIIIDGLDECAGGAAQQTIIQIIAASIKDCTTPFIWLICSRLEPHLVATFNSLEVSAVTYQEELMVSRAIDNDIAKYLTGELAKVGREHDLPVPWPRERDIGILINLSSGLFIYANTVVRFIGDRNSLGPEEQLRAIVALATSVTRGSSEHPLSELDFFYLLIMQRIPAKIIRTVQWILLAINVPHIGTDVIYNRQLLGLSRSQFQTACRTLHSVMKVEADKIVFYHASFIDFVEDPQRSRQFCIWKESALALRAELTQRLRAVCNDPDIEPYSESFRALIRADSNNTQRYQDVRAYQDIVMGFFSLCSAVRWDAAAFTALASINFKRMAELWVCSNSSIPKESIHELFLHIYAITTHTQPQIPEEDRNRIMWSCKDRDRGKFTWEVAQMPCNADWDGSFILGHGQHKCFCWWVFGIFRLQPYRECPPPVNEHRKRPRSKGDDRNTPGLEGTQRKLLRRR